MSRFAIPPRHHGALRRIRQSRVVRQLLFPGFVGNADRVAMHDERGSWFAVRRGLAYVSSMLET